MSFEGKVAVVTGGAQGIGEAYVRLLAGEGAAVVVADVNAERGQALAGALSDSGAAVLFRPTDVSDPAACAACVETATTEFGGVDFLVNNAGALSAYRLPPIHELSTEDYRRVFDINTHSVFYMSRAAIPVMIARGGGAIVNTSSVASWMADGVYAVSKLGVNGLTVALARSLAPHGVRVNAVAPGPTDTTGLRDIGVDVASLLTWAEEHGKPSMTVAAPEDVARMGVYLLSDAARNISGQIVAVDGATVVRQ